MGVLASLCAGDICLKPLRVFLIGGGIIIGFIVLMEVLVDRPLARKREAAKLEAAAKQQVEEE